jgi:hypothetical protein
MAFYNLKNEQIAILTAAMKGAMKQRAAEDEMCDAIARAAVEHGICKKGEAQIIAADFLSYCDEE